MGIGMTNPARGDADQNVGGTKLGHWDFDILQCVTELYQSDTSHWQSESMR
jgi:hypothetical protein